MQKNFSFRMLLSIGLLAAGHSLMSMEVEPNDYEGSEVPTRGSLFASFRDAEGLTDAKAFEKLLRISTMEKTRPNAAKIAEGMIKSPSLETLLLISLEQKVSFISIYATDKISRLPVPDEEQITKAKQWLIKKANKITEKKEAKKEPKKLKKKKKKRKLTRKN